MSSNTIFGLSSPSGANDLLISPKYNDYKIVNKQHFNDEEIFDQLRNIAERIEKMGNKFLNIKYEKDKDKLFSDIGYCFRGLAFDLSCIKNDLKK